MHSSSSFSYKKHSWKRPETISMTGARGTETSSVSRKSSPQHLTSFWPLSAQKWLKPEVSFFTPERLKGGFMASALSPSQHLISPELSQAQTDFSVMENCLMPLTLWGIFKTHSSSWFRHFDPFASV